MIKENIDASKDNQHVIFDIAPTEKLLYGLDGSDEELMKKHNYGKRVKMDDMILTKEILSLYSRKNEYKAKEIAYTLQQSQQNVRRCLRTIAEAVRSGPRDYVWVLKESFQNYEGDL